MSKKVVFENIKTWVEEVIDFPYSDYSKIMNKIGLYSTDAEARATQAFAHQLLWGDHQHIPSNTLLKRELEALRYEFFPVTETELPQTSVEVETTLEIEGDTDAPMPTKVRKEPVAKI